MKNTSGLIVAVILGGAAVVFNWIYLHEKAARFEFESFLGIREGEEIQVGETLLESHFEAVPVPKKYAERLQDYVYLYRDKATVAGIKATRNYEGGDLVHLEDYRTPAEAVRLDSDERLIWVAVDSRAFVPALVNPGDQLTFVFPSASSVAGSPSGETTAETLGPFRIGALGTRLGDVDVDRGYSSGHAEERQVGIIARMDGGELEAKALRLLELTTGGNRVAAVALHPQEEEGG